MLISQVQAVIKCLSWKKLYKLSSSTPSLYILGSRDIKRFNNSFKVTMLVSGRAITGSQVFSSQSEHFLWPSEAAKGVRVRNIFTKQVPSYGLTYKRWFTGFHNNGLYFKARTLNSLRLAPICAFGGEQKHHVLWHSAWSLMDTQSVLIVECLVCDNVGWWWCLEGTSIRISWWWLKMQTPGLYTSFTESWFQQHSPRSMYY